MFNHHGCDGSLTLGSIKAAHNRHSSRCDDYARLNERVFLSLKTLYIYYTTGLPLESSERFNDALHLLYPVDCDLFRPCVYYTTGLPTINPIYLLYHRVVNLFVVYPSYHGDWEGLPSSKPLYLLYHRVTIMKF